LRDRRIFSKIDFQGKRESSWGRRPILFLLFALSIGPPDNDILPESGDIKPQHNFNKVVLPQPLGPIKDTNSPGSTERFILAITGRSILPSE
jgi:hypothetical protein